jgi:hypothetical protein
MIASDLFHLADTLEVRAGLRQPFSLAEMKAAAALLRSVAAKVDTMESQAIPRTKRWPVIDGGGGTAA